MTSAEIEAAVAAYLAAGADRKAAGHPKCPTECPVARATHAFATHEELYINFRWTSHTPAVAAFVALVDNEPGSSVTFGRARALWSEAKGDDR